VESAAAVEAEVALSAKEAAISRAALGLVEFRDPLGLFSISLPKGWYKVRPTAEGDLPDSNGKGRRGARIFSSGDVSNPYAPKVLSVERFPVETLLREMGYATPPPDVPAGGGSSPSWAALGRGTRPEAVAQALVNVRDAELTIGGKSMTTRLVPGSVAVEGDGSILAFRAATDVPVMRPDLLEKQAGRRELTRASLFLGYLRDGETMGPGDPAPPRPVVTAVWLSVEQSDLEEGGALEATAAAVLRSFKVP